MTQRKALIAMSGGVDSAVAAYLTQRSGLDCSGAIMRLHRKDENNGSCGSADDVEDARNVAQKLSMPFHVFDFTAEFRKNVMDKFVRCYECGLTPNPCIDCNRHLKFDRFLQAARELDCDYIVTGHYARIEQDPSSGRYLLKKALHADKDQSYVLHSLTQDQLSHILFPLGSMEKTQVRQIAEEQGFLNARKKDSQDICFVPDGDYLAFMERYTKKCYPSGNFLDLSGKVVGTHKGAAGYTLGQRKGLGLAMGAPVYVCGKDMKKNTVTVGPNEALFSRFLRANDWNWFPFPELTQPIRVLAKTRYRQTEQPATVYPEENGYARVEFDEPQRAITPGQAVVLYDGDTVIGGGTITDVPCP